MIKSHISALQMLHSKVLHFLFLIIPLLFCLSYLPADAALYLVTSTEFFFSFQFTFHGKQLNVLYTQLDRVCKTSKFLLQPG